MEERWNEGEREGGRGGADREKEWVERKDEKVSAREGREIGRAHV